MSKHDSLHPFEDVAQRLPPEDIDERVQWAKEEIKNREDQLKEVVAKIQTKALSKHEAVNELLRLHEQRNTLIRDVYNPACEERTQTYSITFTLTIHESHGCSRENLEHFYDLVSSAGRISMKDIAISPEEAQRIDQNGEYSTHDLSFYSQDGSCGIRIGYKSISEMRFGSDGYATVEMVYVNPIGHNRNPSTQELDEFGIWDGAFLGVTEYRVQSDGDRVTAFTKQFHADGSLFIDYSDPLSEINYPQFLLWGADEDAVLFGEKKVD